MLVSLKAINMSLLRSEAQHDNYEEHSRNVRAEPRLFWVWAGESEGLARAQLSGWR